MSHPIPNMHCIRRFLNDCIWVLCTREKGNLLIKSSVLQLWRVLQMQGINQPKEQAHGMWKIFKVIHDCCSFQNYWSLWRLKVQWRRRSQAALRNHGQAPNGNVGHFYVITVLTIKVSSQSQLHFKCYSAFLW